MENDFIKLKLPSSENYIYIRPQDIRCLEWDAEAKTTNVGLAYSGDYIDNTPEVAATPGEIFEACRKVLAQQGTK